MKMIGCVPIAGNRVTPVSLIGARTLLVVDLDRGTKALRKWASADYSSTSSVSVEARESSFDNSCESIKPRASLSSRLKRYENGPFAVNDDGFYDPIKPSTTSNMNSTRNDRAQGIKGTELKAIEPSSAIVSTRKLSSANRTVPSLFARYKDLEAISIVGDNHFFVYRTISSNRQQRTKMIVGQDLATENALSASRQPSRTMRRYPVFDFSQEEDRLMETQLFVGSPHAFRALMRERMRRSVGAEESPYQGRGASLPNHFTFNNKPATASSNAREVCMKASDACFILRQRIRLMAIVGWRSVASFRASKRDRSSTFSTSDSTTAPAVATAC